MAVVNFGKADDEIAGGFLCLIEFAGMHEIDRGVGRFGQLVWFLLESRTSHLRLELGLLGSRHGGLCGEDSTLRRLILLEATALIFLPAAAVAWIIASGLVRHGGHFIKEGDPDVWGVIGGQAVLRAVAAVG
jgi:hypothetical protein